MTNLLDKEGLLIFLDLNIRSKAEDRNNDHITMDRRFDADCQMRAYSFVRANILSAQFETNHQELSSIIVNHLESDIADRRGLKQEWERIDDTIKDGIRQSWHNIIAKTLDASPDPVTVRSAQGPLSEFLHQKMSEWASNCQYCGLLSRYWRSPGICVARIPEPAQPVAAGEAKERGE